MCTRPIQDQNSQKFSHEREKKIKTHSLKERERLLKQGTCVECEYQQDTELLEIQLVIKI